MKVIVNGTISAVLAQKSGVSKAGKEWKSQEFVLQEEEGTLICFIVNANLKLYTFNDEKPKFFSVFLYLASLDVEITPGSTGG